MQIVQEVGVVLLCECADAVLLRSAVGVMQSRARRPAVVCDEPGAARGRRRRGRRDP